MEHVLEVFMYQTTVKGKGLFQAISQGYGEPASVPLV